MQEQSSRDNAILILLFLLFYVVIVFRNAWVCDDAFLSFRAVDNFVHGYGLRWNVAERVQSFTNPLWVLLLIPLHALSHEIYFTVLGLSLVCCVAALLVYAFTISKTTVMASAGILVLAVSDAFIDFSTSGLENPLTFLLLALFVALWLRSDFSSRSLLRLSFVAAAAAVNRMDTILFYLPALAYMFLRMRSKAAVKALVLGFSPFILWECFALFYYGVPFPNPAYAKLSLNIDRAYFLGQGLFYLLSSIIDDPVTIIVICMGVIAGLIQSEWKIRMLAAGIGLYLVYTVYIGGCFMYGRFFAAPLLVSIALLGATLKNPNRTALAGSVLVLIVLSITSPRSPIWTPYRDSETKHHIRESVMDERIFYYPASGLTNFHLGFDVWPDHLWSREITAMSGSGNWFFVRGPVGMYGYFGGPETVIMDELALADPLLCRMDIFPYTDSVVGHIQRDIPPGYVKSYKTGENCVSDPNLAFYYEKIQSLTRGKLFSLGRLRDILAFNAGFYDSYRDTYKNRARRILTLQALDERVPIGRWYMNPTNLFFDTAGIKVNLGEVHHEEIMEVSRDHDDSLVVEYCLDSAVVATGIIEPKLIPRGGSVTSLVTVPMEAVSTGYNCLLITPGDQKNFNFLGHMFLYEDLAEARKAIGYAVVQLSDYSDPKKEGTPWNDLRNVDFSFLGIEIDLEQTRIFSSVELSLDHNDDYRVTFIRDGREEGHADIEAANTEQGGLAVYTIEVPQQVVREGADLVKIEPIGGDGMYGFGHIRLLN